MEIICFFFVLFLFFFSEKRFSLWKLRGKKKGKPFSTRSLFAVVKVFLAECCARRGRPVNAQSFGQGKAMKQRLLRSNQQNNQMIALSKAMWHEAPWNESFSHAATNVFPLPATDILKAFKLSCARKRGKEGKASLAKGERKEKKQHFHVGEREKYRKRQKRNNEISTIALLFHFNLWFSPL